MRNPGSGRRPGSKNKATIAYAAMIAESGLTPLEFMLRVMQNTNNKMETRMDAAKAAAPYIHPRLNAMTLDGEVNSAMTVTIVSYSEAGPAK